MKPVFYTLTLADYTALAMCIEKRRAGFVRLMFHWIFPVFFSFVAALLLLIQWLKSGLLPHNAEDLGTLASAFVLLGFASATRIERRIGFYQLSRKSAFGTEANVQLEDDGVRARSGMGESLIFWTHILDLQETPTHFFLFLNKNQAFIVPKRAFAMPEESQHFVSFAQNCWNKVHPAIDAPPIAKP